MAPLINSTPSRIISPEPFLLDAFSPFGTAIFAPLASNINVIPSTSSLPFSTHHPDPVVANQSTALKFSPISPLINNYTSAPSSRPSKPLMTLFACFPRKLSSSTFPVRILERHPYTTQTFTPLGLPRDSETYFLVIVAPSLPGTTTATLAGKVVQVQTPPDLTRLRAFISNGAQAVTYGAGTWHAPMVVLGKKRVDFVVTQFANGVGDEDCQEVEFGEGLEVDLDHQTKAKL